MYKLGLDKLHQCCNGHSNNKQWVGGDLEIWGKEEGKREREIEREGTKKLEVRHYRRRKRA